MFSGNKSLLVVILLSIFFLNCNAGTKKCNSWLECYGKTINKDAVECTALSACASTTINSPNVTCDAKKACQSSEMTNVRDGQCDGYKACRKSEITVNGEMECGGYASCSCSDLIVNEDASLYCTGRQSCRYFNQAWIVCLRNSDSLKLYGNLECSGELACFSSDIKVKTTSESILCDGDQSCRWTEIYLANNLENEFTIDGEAEYALSYGLIESGENNTLSISLDGYLAGDNLDVYCESGSTCEIDCEGEACDNETTILYCADDATCDTDCNCDTDSCATIVTWDDSIQGMTMKQKLTQLEKEKELRKKQSQNMEENTKKFDMKRYQTHLKFGGNPVSYQTLNNYKNNMNGYLWNKDHYTMLFGVIITIISGLLLYSLYYYCNKHNQKVNNFEEYQQLPTNYGSIEN